VTDLVPYLMVDIVHIHQIYLMFRSRLLAPDFHPTRESSEVKLLDEADIPWDDIAFKVIEKPCALLTRIVHRAILSSGPTRLKNGKAAEIHPRPRQPSSNMRDGGVI
jgi:hypothetical protein